jgi:hypothetical protein
MTHAATDLGAGRTLYTFTGWPDIQGRAEAGVERPAIVQYLDQPHTAREISQDMNLTPAYVANLLYRHRGSIETVRYIGHRKVYRSKAS